MKDGFGRHIRGRRDRFDRVRVEWPQDDVVELTREKAGLACIFSFGLLAPPALTGERPQSPKRF